MKIYFNKQSIDKNNLDISLDELFCINHKWDYGVYENISFNINEHQLKLENDTITIINKTKTKQEKSQLLIKKILSKYSNFDILNYDFTLLAELEKESPLYDKGRKVKSSYIKNGHVYIEKIFTDVYSDDNKLTGILMDINWYNEDGSIGLTKQQLIKKFNSAELKTELRKRRNRIIDYLIARAEDLNIDWFINILLKEFKTEIELFIENKTSDFYNSIISELDNENSKSITNPNNGSQTTIRDFLKTNLGNGQFLYEAILEDLV